MDEIARVTPTSRGVSYGKLRRVGAAVPGPTRLAGDAVPLCRPVSDCRRPGPAGAGGVPPALRAAGEGILLPQWPADVSLAHRDDDPSGRGAGLREPVPVVEICAVDAEARA